MSTIDNDEASVANALDHFLNQRQRSEARRMRCKRLAA